MVSGNIAESGLLGPFFRFQERRPGSHQHRDERWLLPVGGC